VTPFADELRRLIGALHGGFSWLGVTKGDAGTAAYKGTRPVKSIVGHRNRNLEVKNRKGAYPALAFRFLAFLFLAPDF